jgi:large subunit ribosomal protein L23
MSANKVSVKALQCIQHPLITEKSQLVSENSCYVFRVRREATKPQIKEAIEALFAVNVKAVNTLIQKGKMKSFRGKPGRRKDEKKAYITLQKGQTIELGANG